MRLFQPNKKYTEIALYVCAACGIATLLLAALLNAASLLDALGRLFSILSPVLYGFAFAYLLRPPTRLYERLLARRIKRELPLRVLALVCTYLSVFGILFIFIYFVLPLLVGDGQALWQRLLSLMHSFFLWLEKTAKEYQLPISATDIENTLYKNLPALLDFVRTFGSGVVMSLYKLFIGAALSVPLLYHRTYIKAITRRFAAAQFSRRVCSFLHSFAHYTDKIFGRYLIGKIFEAVIIFTLYIVIFLIIRMPYAALVATIMTIMNFIPMIGAYLGAIPCAVIVLTESPWMVLWLVITVLVMEQLNGLLITPKVIGSVIGIKGVWIIGSIALFGGFFGVVGMFLAAPLFGIVYMLVRDGIAERLRRKNMPTATAAYADYYVSSVPPRKQGILRRIVKKSGIGRHLHEAADQDTDTVTEDGADES